MYTPIKWGFTPDCAGARRTVWIDSPDGNRDESSAQENEGQLKSERRREPEVKVLYPTAMPCGARERLWQDSSGRATSPRLVGHSRSGHAPGGEGRNEAISGKWVPVRHQDGLVDAAWESPDSIKTNQTRLLPQRASGAERCRGPRAP